MLVYMVFFHCVYVLLLLLTDYQSQNNCNRRSALPGTPKAYYARMSEFRILGPPSVLVPYTCNAELRAAVV